MPLHYPLLAALRTATMALEDTAAAASHAARISRERLQLLEFEFEDQRNGASLPARSTSSSKSHEGAESKSG